MTMYEVMMIVDNEEYSYGVYADRNKANEVAMWRRDLGVETYVREVQR